MERIKNVDVKQCIGMIIFCIFAFATVLIPFVISDVDFALYHLPIVGNGDFVPKLSTYVDFLLTMTGLYGMLGDAISIVHTICDYSLYVFYGIVAFDFLFALILAIFRISFLRVIAKIISILAGFIMLALFLINLVYVVGFIAYTASIFDGENDILTMAQTGGGLFLFIVMIFSFLLISKQFKWFRRYY